MKHHISHRDLNHSHAALESALVVLTQSAFTNSGRTRSQSNRRRASTIRRIASISSRLTGRDFTCALDEFALEHGALRGKISIDNGTKFASKRLDECAYLIGVKLDFSGPGKLTDNGLIEACNGRLSAECLNENWFLSLEYAKEKVESWSRHYSADRPQNALGNLASKVFAVPWLTAGLVHVQE